MPHLRINANEIWKETLLRVYGGGLVSLIAPLFQRRYNNCLKQSNQRNNERLLLQGRKIETELIAFFLPPALLNNCVFKAFDLTIKVF